MSSAPELLPEGRRARRKAETRQRLLRAARELFSTRGFDATRPQDIARAADLATGTFYVHFADKGEAFHAFAAQAGEELMAEMGRRIDGARGFEERLLRSLEALHGYAERNPGVLSAAFADAAVIAAGVPSGASLRDRLADSLARGLQADMDAGRLARDFDARVIAHGMVGMIHAACTHGVRADLSPRQLFENLTRFCGRALAVEASEDAER
ncbi:MAG: TetR/AcrR family transcriptional regulator [Myxococcota bacterium]